MKMKRSEFKAIAQQALERIASVAEEQTGLTLSRKFCFGWIATDTIAEEEDVAEYLVSATFVDESHISPCFDLFLEKVLPDGRLFLTGYCARYEPCEYGDHFNYQGIGHNAGRVGPFKLGTGNFIKRHGEAKRDTTSQST